MGAIKTVPHFQGGGLMDGSMLFPPLDQGQTSPAPPSGAPAPAPAAPSEAPQPPALNINPNYPQGNAPVTEVPTDDNIERDKAWRQDEPILRNNVLSHTGDHRFLTEMPKRVTEEEIQSTPEYQRLQMARDYVNQNGQNQKPADLKRAIGLIDAQEKALRKKHDTDYNDKFKLWKQEESNQ